MDSQIDPLPVSTMADLSPAECRRRLRAATAGRVAWTAPDGPQILPVSSVWRSGTVVFRTSPTGLLSALQHRTYVAYEIDSIGVAEAWSVVVRGVAQQIHESYDLIELWEDEGLVPWAPGRRSLFIEIQPQTISGRSYAAPSD